MNYIILAFSFITTGVIIFGSLINSFENKLPVFFVRIFRYGKFSCKGEIPEVLCKLILEVPKSWFKHFYRLAILVYAYIFYIVTCTYIFKYDVPIWFYNAITVLCGEGRIAYTSATKTYLAVVLLTLQVYRRFYDTHFVSVFGKNGKINLSAYLIGLYHYVGSAFAILSEAPKFADHSVGSFTLNITDITYLDIFATMLFLWAWWHQHVTSKILADLRKNKEGAVVTDDYKLPHGDWFDYFSCPHQIAEILMYMSLTIILWQNITWFFVFAWVLCNQVETILLSHWWYQETFEKFPKNRKALIPFVY